MKRFLLLGLVALMPLTSVVAQNPTEILTKAEKSAIGTSSYSELSMSAKRARYTRELDIKSWTHTNKYALIVVTGPNATAAPATCGPTSRCTALFREPERW